jgi:rhamnosyltransferase
MNAMPSAVSVVMRCFNEAFAVADTIRMLRQQDFDGEIELIVIDSGSSDGSVELIETAKPEKFIRIPLGTYVPGPVLNRGHREASHEWIVYLNADATPADDLWLRRLLEPCLASPTFGAGFSRQLPRPDCHPVFAHDYDRCFGPQRESAHWDHFFSMVSCVTTRTILADVPIREDLQYAEDDEWTRRLRRHGYEVIFAPDSRCYHSHNYTVRQSYKRAYGDAKAMAATSTTDPGAVNLHYFVALGWLRDVARDLRWLADHGKLTGLPEAMAVRLAQRLGRRRGHHDGWQAYGRDQTKP